MSPRALAPLLLAVACAAGDAESTSVGTASMPTMPGYMPPGTTTDAATEASTSSNSDDPTTAASPASNPSSEPPDTTSSSDPATSEITVTTTGPAPDTGDDTTTTTPPGETTNVDTGQMCDANTCTDPPGPCFDSPGVCIVGMCDYPPSADGKDCDDGDPCTDNDVCNGAGSCGGTAKSCPSPANATPGACQNGECTFNCIDPYEDCDGEVANGCEVPTGIANKCDVNGLTDSGCWTAYCGNNVSAKKNFGAFYCMDCVNCHEPAAGQWQWCNHTAGSFYPSEAGNCPAADENKVCAP